MQVFLCCSCTRHAASTRTITHVAHPSSDERWEAFVAAMLAVGPVLEGRSRFADKPALFVANREIAHLEAPGVIDLRVTRTGWARAKDQYGSDPVVTRDPRRRDWVELHPRTVSDVDRLGPLLAIAQASNL